MARTAAALTLVMSTLVIAGCSQLPFLSSEVPDVTGFTGVRANQILKDAGFEVEGWNAACDRTRVENQVPAGGDRAEKGSTVTLAVDCLDPPPSTPWWK